MVRRVSDTGTGRMAEWNPGAFARLIPEGLTPAEAEAQLAEETASASRDTRPGSAGSPCRGGAMG